MCKMRVLTDLAAYQKSKRLEDELADTEKAMEDLKEVAGDVVEEEGEAEKSGPEEEEEEDVRLSCLSSDDGIILYCALCYLDVTFHPGR
jgi:hypothetical protein